MPQSPGRTVRSFISAASRAVTGMRGSFRTSDSGSPTGRSGEEVSNMATGAVVTTVGKGLSAASMAADHTARYVAMGTGTTTPAVTDTALATASDLNSGSAWLEI